MLYRTLMPKKRVVDLLLSKAGFGPEHYVVPFIRQGDVVQGPIKNIDYEIDRLYDMSCMKFEDLSEFLYEHFMTRSEQVYLTRIRRMFPYTEKQVVPFKFVFESRVGACEEKSIMTQMWANRVGIESFLVMLNLSLDDEGLDEGINHVVNVFNLDKGPVLVDMNLSRKTDKGQVLAYNSRVLGIDKGRFVLEDNMTFKRYTLLN